MIQASLLKAQREKLKDCETVVTTSDGTQYKEYFNGNALVTEELIEEEGNDKQKFGFVVDTKPDAKLYPISYLKSKER